MKALLIATLFSTAALAAPGDLLLTCTRTAFTDLEKIVITQSDNGIEVSETDQSGRVTTYQRPFTDWSHKDIELSDWYGYTRKLQLSDNSWGIDHHDECGGGYSYAICQ